MKKHHITSKDTTVAEVLKEHFRLKPKEIRAYLELGAVYHDHLRVFEDIALPKGSYLRIHTNPKRYPVEGIKWRQTILCENELYVVINKPFGIPVHATPDNARDNVLVQLRSLLEVPLFVVNRLDTVVGGVLLLAKSEEFQSRFNDLLKEKKITKHYRALTSLELAPGIKTHFMDPAETIPKKVSEHEREGTLKCELSVLRSKQIKLLDLSCWESEIDLLTGRTHQIRAQLKELGAPILGDSLYGSRVKFTPLLSKGSEKGRGIGLFSSHLAFEWAGKKECFTLTPPWES
jgi:23S rRNA pseudouridine1911/1915/1917 synthase